MVGYGLAFFSVSMSTSLIRYILIPAGLGRWVLAATATSLILGLTVMVAAVPRIGPAGTGLAMGTAEFVCLITVATASILHFKSKRTVDA